jgi:hypothetical protein
VIQGRVALALTSLKKFKSGSMLLSDQPVNR